PGDVEQVRRLGVDKWIEQQLHPDQIAENPSLETKVKPLETVYMATWQISEKYPQTPAGLMIKPPTITTLSPQIASRLRNGSVEERRTTLASLDPETRKGVLATGPPQMLEGLPQEIQDEAATARKADQEERQKEFRRIMPPLNELLSPDQMRIARTG